jgi:hypothetical protein
MRTQSFFNSESPLDLNKISLLTLLSSLGLIVILYIVNRFYIYSHASVNPYQLMRLLYVVGLILILPLILSSQWVLSRIECFVFPRAFPAARVKKILAVFWIALITYLVVQQNFMFLPVDSIFFSKYYLSFIVLGFLLIYCCLSTRPSKIKTYVYYALILLSIFVLMALFGQNALWIYYSPSVLFSSNFNAVFSSVVQASHQKLPLVDYYAQYGYYSLFLSFIFQLIPLTLRNYTLVMSTLVVMIFAFLFLGLRNVIANYFIRFVGLMACVYALFLVGGVYWANLPVRYFFPSFVFYLVSQYNLTRSVKLYYFIFLIVTLSVAWNLDTGAVLFFSWLFILSYIKLTASNLKFPMRPLLKIWMTGFVYVCVMLGLFATYTWLEKGVLPDYSHIFIFQHLFFGLGIMSLPLKSLDTWSLVILIYIVGFIYGLSVARTETNEALHNRAAIIVFLCCMGSGFFSYFIMRSYPTNIFVVCWPAVILLAIFSDSMVKADRPLAFFSLLPLILWALSAMAMILPSSLLPLFRQLPQIVGQDLIVLSAQREWVKSLGLEKKNVIILSEKSGIFYMDSHAINPVFIPGATEILSPIFVSRIVEYAKNSKVSGFLLVDIKMTYYTHPLFDELRNLYALLPVVKKSSDGELILFSFN